MKAAQGWQGTFLTDPPRPVRHVSVGGGLVVAGGDELIMLRPGALRHGKRALPAGAGLVLVAVEPWAPRRYAVAMRGSVVLFSGGQPDEELMQLSFKQPDVEPTHMAWTREAGESRLYLRGRDGALLRLRPDAEAFETLEAPPMAAIASDAAGALATLDIVTDQDVSLTRADGTREGRPLTLIPDLTGDDDTILHLATSGGAVAYGAGSLGVCVSWAEGEDFEYCDGLMGGPIAFQGDDALVCAYSVETTIRVLRRTRAGVTSCLAEIETPWSPDASLTLSAIAWDASRRVLWGASPELGLLVLREPGVGGSSGLVAS